MAVATDRLTYEQYMAEPEIRRRYDILDGVRVFMTNPTIQHQKIYLLQPGQGNAAPGNFAAQNLERAQLIRVLVSQAETIQRFTTGFLVGLITLCNTVTTCRGRVSGVAMSGRLNE